jgi:hypothetical protein
MYRLFEPEMRRCEKPATEHSRSSVREPATMQMRLSGSNPQGGWSIRSIHRRCVGHDALRHRFLLAPHLGANGPTAIGTATSSEAP